MRSKKRFAPTPADAESYHSRSKGRNRRRIGMRLFPGNLPKKPCGRRIAWLAVIAVPSTLMAQAPGFQLGAMYQCPAAQSFKVFSCSGSKDADPCDVQSYNGGQPSQRGKAPYAQVAAMARLCHLQSAGEAQSQAKAGEQPDAN